MVLPTLECIWTPTLPHTSLKLFLSPLVYGTTMLMLLFLLLLVLCMLRVALSLITTMSIVFVGL